MKKDALNFCKFLHMLTQRRKCDDGQLVKIKFYHTEVNVPY